MRILAVTPYYEPEGGGLERYAHEILRRLSARGHEVRTLSFTHKQPSHKAFDHLTVRRKNAPLCVGNTPVDPTFGHTVRRSIRSFAPDIVVAHTPVPFPAQAAFGAARRAGVPFVTTYHAGRLRGSSRPLDLLASLDRNTLERRMLDRSDGLIAVTPFVRDHALARHRDRVTVVPPGVDAGRFRPCGPPKSKQLLFVGPLAESYRWKGVDVLMPAFRRVLQAHPDAGLTLVGDGDRRQALAAQAQAEGLPVRCLGRLSDDELRDEYCRAAALVLPSTTDAESFGMVLAEANACGRPVIASRVGGIPDFVDHGVNGLLAEPGDAKDLAQQIMTLFEGPEAAHQMGQAGRVKVQREHDWWDLTRATERVLDAAAYGG